MIHKSSSSTAVVKFLIVIGLASSLLGCGDVPVDEEFSLENFPLINPDDPSTFKRWEESPYNFSNAKVIVLKLRLFHGHLGDSSEKELSSVAVQVSRARIDGITPEQQLAIDDFVQNETKMHAAVREAIYGEYQNSYPAYKEGLSLGGAMFGGGGDINDILPKISAGDELDNLVQVGTVSIHPPIDGNVAIGIDFIVPWDEEHGIGLRIQDGKVIAIGTAHEAFPILNP